MTARLDLVVRGGTVVAHGEATVQDIGISGGRIVALAEHLEDAETLIDACGRLVLPGGVDAHCHMDQPSYGAACADDVRSGTRAAACGGTTTVIPFAMAIVAASLAATVAAWRERAQPQALIDYGVHPTLQAATPQILQDAAALIEDGCASLKAFTTYDGFMLDDAALLAAMRVVARHGALLMVHAENDAIVALRTRELIDAGHHAPRFHAEARPVLAETEAIQRVACLAEATGARVLIVHVSSADGLAAVRRARARGVRIHAETCPHYLLLSEADLDRPGLEGATFVCSPPLRRLADQVALRDGLVSGDIAVWSSDHSPSRLAGADGKLRRGPHSRFDQIANGLPGIELRLPLLFSEVYLRGHIGLAAFAALASGNAAALHGIAPQKGDIAIGADADLVLWDPDRETTVTHALLHDGTDYTPYEGMRLRGWPITTISRGEMVVDDGRILGAAGRGRFVPSRPVP